MVAFFHDMTNSATFHFIIKYVLDGRTILNVPIDHADGPFRQGTLPLLNSQKLLILLEAWLF